MKIEVKIVIFLMVLIFSWLLYKKLEEPTQPPRHYTIEYNVTGDSRSADITYTTPSGSTEMAMDQSLPWSKRFEVAENSKVYLQLMAQNKSSYGNIEVRIITNNQIFKNAVSSGGYSIASCSGAVSF